MSTEFASLSISDKYSRLLKVTSSERFLQMQGLGKEVPFFICPFSPSQAVEMSRLVQNLVSSLAGQSIHVLEINLYDLSKELLVERGVWERVLEMETTSTKEQFKELLQGMLDPEQHLIPAISQKMESGPFDVLFLSGIGEVFPYIRSHNLLNNLQKAAKTRPSVLFFPGDYSHSLESGASLNLFSSFPDDRYYRAFDISQYEV